MRKQKLAIHMLLAAIFICALPFTGAAGCGETASTDSPQSGLPFHLDFPKDFTTTADPAELSSRNYFPMADADMVLGGYYSGKTYEKTNFRNASIAVSICDTAAQKADCADMDGSLLCGEDGGVKDVTIHGVSFRYATISDAAVGNRLQARQYWTIHDGKRYEILLSMSYSDIGMYTPGEVKEFDSNACWGQLEQAAESFRFEPDEK